MSLYLASIFRVISIYKCYNIKVKIQFGGNTMKFYICKHCGNIIHFMNESGVSVVCCGEKMEELNPGTTDAVVEKHVPAVTVDGNKIKVCVGSVLHPMTPEHYITWILIETNKGCHMAKLSPNDMPCAEFVLADGEEYIAAYEYCNLHGLWKA